MDDRAWKAESVVNGQYGKEVNDGQRHHEATATATDGSQLPRWRLICLMLAIFIGLFLSFLDTTIVAVALATIAKHFGEFDNSSWVFTAYLLTYMAFGIILSRLSDTLGTKTMEAACMVLFLAMSIGCALSTGMTELIIFRAFQGAGGSGLFSLTSVIALKSLSPKHYPLIGSYISVTQAVAAIVGPIISGAITQDRSSSEWRWIFYLNLPIGGLALILLLISSPRQRGDAIVTWTKLKKVDYVGSGLLLAASVLLIFALQEAGSYAYAWDSGAIISTLCLSACSMVTFVFWELLIIRRPSLGVQFVFPVDLVTSRVDGAIMAATVINGFTFYIVVVYLPDRFQIVGGDNPVTAGLRLLPLLAGSAVGTFVAGGLSSRRNLTAYTLIVASSLQIIGYGLMTKLEPNKGAPNAVYGYQIILGIGFGAHIASTTLAVIFRFFAQPEYTAVMQGCQTQLRTFGACLGIAIGNVIYNHRMKSSPALTAALTASQQESLYKSPLVIETFGKDEERLVGRVYASLFEEQMQVCLYVAAAGLVASMLCWQRKPPPPASEQAHNQNCLHMESPSGEVVP